MSLNNWDRRYLAIAMQVAQWSKDPSSRMGAVIANAEGRLVSFGFNGFPKNVEDCQSRLHNPPIKYEFVVHAEANAVLIARGAAVGVLCTCTGGGQSVHGVRVYLLKQA
jgi:deoxycytidylate deaminase